MSSQQSKPFLRIPPFPGARSLTIVSGQAGPAEQLDESRLRDLLDEICRLRVGGDYWAAQPRLMNQGHVLVRVRDSKQRATVVAELGRDRPVVVWTDENEYRSRSN